MNIVVQSINLQFNFIPLFYRKPKIYWVKRNLAILDKKQPKGTPVSRLPNVLRPWLKRLKKVKLKIWILTMKNENSTILILKGSSGNLGLKSHWKE